MDKKKIVWLVNHYAMPPEFEPRLRTIKFAEYLKKFGYEIRIFAASTLHNMEINLISSKKKYIERKYGDLDFVHIRTRSYNNYFQRVLNLMDFSFRFKRISKVFPKPDIILHTANVPFGYSFSSIAKKLNARYIVEILDLWPESFVLTGLIRRRNPILPMLYQIEKSIYKKADSIIFSMEGGKDYIVKRKLNKDNGGPIDLRKVYYINNGVDLDEFNRNLENYTFQDLDLKDDTTFKVIYLGSIRLFNNIKLIIDAAEKLKEFKKIKFLIYGDGNERSYLESYVKTNNISNVIFKAKRVEKKFIPSLLSQSSLNLINYQQNGLWNYGGSQSKMFQYLASGRPILSNIVPSYCVIRKNNCGISKTFSNAQEYANAILEISNLDAASYKNMCDNAKKGALEFDYPILTEKLIDTFKN